MSEWDGRLRYDRDSRAYGTGDDLDRAERRRDLTHVSRYTRDEFAAMAEAAGLRALREALFPKRHEMGDPVGHWVRRRTRR